MYPCPLIGVLLLFKAHDLLFEGKCSLKFKLNKFWHKQIRVNKQAEE